MESAVFHLNGNELDKSLIEQITALFKNQKITLLVVPQDKKATVSKLTKTLQAQEAVYDYVVPAQAFETLADRFLEDDSFDIAQAIRQYKSPVLTK